MGEVDGRALWFDCFDSWRSLKASLFDQAKLPSSREEFNPLWLNCSWLTWLNTKVISRLSFLSDRDAVSGRYSAYLQHSYGRFRP